MTAFGSFPVGCRRECHNAEEGVVVKDRVSSGHRSIFYLLSSVEWEM